MKEKVFNYSPKRGRMDPPVPCIKEAGFKETALRCFAGEGIMIICEERKKGLCESVKGFILAIENKK